MKTLIKHSTPPEYILSGEPKSLTWEDLPCLSLSLLFCVSLLSYFSSLTPPVLISCHNHDDRLYPSGSRFGNPRKNNRLTEHRTTEDIPDL
jgi:hypothetical protein